MPLYVRHLPGQIMNLIDTKAIPDHQALFNPSVAHPIVYIRNNVHYNEKEDNNVTLVNLDTKQNYNIPSPDNFLKKNCNLFQGIEDLRICWFKDLLWFTATSTHASDNMTSEMLVGHFDSALTKVERMSFIDLGSRPMKNVCPYVYNDTLYLFDIFMMCTYEVKEVLSDAGVWQAFEAPKVQKLVYGTGLTPVKYRGSTSPVKLHGNTWGCVVHDIIFNDQTVLVTRLSYIHHWIEFDVVTGVISFVSTPFWIAHWGIEYVSGLHVSFKSSKSVPDEVTLYIGVNDKSSVVCVTSIANLRYGK
jgi:hypothetical protein